MTNYDTEIANFSVQHPKMDVFMGVSIPENLIVIEHLRAYMLI